HAFIIHLNSDVKRKSLSSPFYSLAAILGASHRIDIPANVQ
ncbi:MAG: hypothetical protein ACI814_005057, partial [Mariniblastus sp.]